MAVQRSISDYFSSDTRLKKRSTERGIAEETITTENIRPPNVDDTATKLTMPSSDENSFSIDQQSSSPLEAGELAAYRPPLKKSKFVGLSNYIMGAPTDPDFFATDTAQRRHQAFKKSVGGRQRVPHARVVKPYEQQYIELKRNYMDSILAVQNGYKYQIYGNDAYEAGKALGRTPIAGWRELDEGRNEHDALYDRFASITFPIEALPIYVEKLVANGFKVAVANQVETAGLKALSDNKRGPFTRKVQHIYTKGTLVEELTTSSDVSGHIMAVARDPLTQKIGLVAVQLATGHAVCDEFSDTEVLMELETRILHIQPAEILRVGGSESIGPAATSLLATIPNKTGTARFEDVPAPESNVVEEALAAYPQDSLRCLGGGAKETAFAALLVYLKEFGLTTLFEMPQNMKPFSLQSHMYLNGDTLSSLEIFVNQTDYSLTGSLLWVVDATATRFGHRLLRKWLAQPLLEREAVSERGEAVEELLEGANLWECLHSSMRSLPDLERYVLQIYYGRINPRQLYLALHYFKFISIQVTESQIQACGIRSPLLLRLLSQLPRGEEVVTPFLQRIDCNHIRQCRKNIEPQHFFRRDESNADLQVLANLEDELAELASDFEAHLKKEAQNLGISLNAARVIGEEYVISVPKRDAKKVPADWRRINTTTSESRFRSPYAAELAKKHLPLTEKISIAASHAYEKFVREISHNLFGELRCIVATLAQLDCLLALAITSRKPGWVRPNLVDEQVLDIEDGRHPMIEQLSLDPYIPNSVHMSEIRSRTMILTGPNMGGKSSLVRQVALLVILAQIGCRVPAKRMQLSLVDAIYTRMGAFDNMIRGESTFMVELKECSAILDKATPRSLVLLDEIGRGTSTLDGVAIAYAVVYAMVDSIRALTLFITHYPILTELVQQFPDTVTNWSMDAIEDKTTRSVTFLYHLVNRVARRSYGVNVARLAHLPMPILENAERISSNMESRLTSGPTIRPLLSRALSDSREIYKLIEAILSNEEESTYEVAL